MTAAGRLLSGRLPISNPVACSKELQPQRLETAGCPAVILVFLGIAIDDMLVKGLRVKRDVIMSHHNEAGLVLTVNTKLWTAVLGFQKIQLYLVQ